MNLDDTPVTGLAVSGVLGKLQASCHLRDRLQPLER